MTRDGNGHPESVVPTFIRKAGDSARPIEDKIREFAALPSVRFTPGEVEEIRRIGDNTGCMMLKGASKRPDEWPMRDDLLETAGRLPLAFGPPPGHPMVFDARGLLI